jgi:hypothetical protein
MLIFIGDSVEAFRERLENEDGKFYKFLKSKPFRGGSGEN